MIGKVGFIGLGTMGKPMALNIAQAGFDLMVYDVRQEALAALSDSGAKVASSVAQVAEHAELVEIAVLDDAQIETALFGEDGVLAWARPGTLVAVHSTVLPKTMTRIAESAAARDMTVVDAPISGGEGGAYGKRLCYMVGASKESFERTHPVFATSAAEILHVGDVGAGTAAKVVNQILVCVNMLAMFEGISLAEKMGLDLEMLQQVLHNGAAQSYMADHWFERIERISKSPETVRHQWEGFDKTLSVALECASDLGVSLPGTALTRQLLAQIVGYSVR